jgi:hypothetical protein
MVVFGLAAGGAALALQRDQFTKARQQEPIIRRYGNQMA